MNIKDRQWYKRFKHDEFKDSHNNSRYRNVPFIIDTSEFVGGRRTVEHEYPQRDITYSEDLGRALRKFTINGKLLGDNYLEQRDNLVNACEIGGLGEFVHPYYGILNVICKQFAITDTSKETRVCNFQLVLVETNNQNFPVIKIDYKSEVNKQVNLAITHNKSFFESVFNSIRKQIMYIQGKRETLSSSLSAINKAKKLTGMSAEYFRLLQATEAQINTLVLSPSDLFDDVKDLIAFGILDELDTIDYVKSFFGLKSHTMDFETDSVIVSDDTTYIQEMVQEVTVIIMCSLISKIEFVSSDEAVYYRDIVLEKIDSLMLVITDNQILQDMKDLRKVVFEDVENRSLDLPSIVEHTESSSLPAIVLSYKLYGNVDQEQSLLDRNKIQNPNFVPGGIKLEVLTDV